MNRLLLMLVVVLSLSFGVRAAGPDEQYVRIYQLIQEADRLNETGQAKAAAARYVEAQSALTQFRGIYPGWNERVVTYRLNYVATKLAPLTAALTAAPPAAAPAVTAPGTNTPAVVGVPVVPPATPSPTPVVVPSIPSAEMDQQIKAMQAEIERLQGDSRLLSAKLKEALSVQPAGIDPRELAKSEERVRSLQKENELMRVQMAQKPNVPAPVTPPPPAPGPDLSGKVADLSAKMAEQNEALASMRAENEVLKKQSTEWQQKFEGLLTSTAAAESDRAAERSRTLEKEKALQLATADNNALQRQVELWKQVAQSNQRQAAAASIPAMPVEAQRELLTLRARVQTLEAQPVPYTTEELALFQKPAPTLVTNSPANLAANLAVTTPASVPPAEGPVSTKGTQGVPTGAGPLVKAAERAFAKGNYAEAEKKYQEVLQQDQNNFTTLGNLASAQLEQGHIADAEKNAQRALELAPDDYFARYLIGRIRFQQDKLDAALDALSRSAQLNPDYAEAQNYLGIVLSEKGQRGPAEAALRRAIQLQPDNAVAHNNLAVVYATQTPPALALARWHYQKALAGGHPKNAELEKMLAPVAPK